VDRTITGSELNNLTLQRAKKNQFKKGDKKEMSKENEEQETKENTDEEKEETEKSNTENEENAENKTAFEIFQEKLKAAKTPAELHQAYKEYARAQIVEEEKSRLLDAAEESEIKRKEREITKMPEKIEALTAQVKELTDLAKEQGTRLMKIEEMPDRKDTGDTKEEDEIGDPIFKKYLEAGGGEWGFRAAQKEMKRIKEAANA